MAVLRLRTSARLEYVLNQFATSVVEARTGGYIFQEGRKAHGCYLVTNGKLRLYLGTTNGKKALDIAVGKGCLVGLPATINEHDYSLSCQAISDSTLALLRRDDIIRLMHEDADAAVLLLDFLSTEVQEVRRAVATYS